jgi:hypothetical protein
MPTDVYYRGEIRVSPPLSEDDAKVFAAVVNLRCNPISQSVFAAIEASPNSELPYYGGQLEVSEDGDLITPEEGESRDGAGMWLKLLIEHFFQPRGYSLTGEIWREGEDGVERSCTYVQENQIDDDVFDVSFNPGPRWSRCAFADEHLTEVIKQLVRSADNTGCSPDLTVVSSEHVDQLKAIHEKLMRPPTSLALDSVSTAG